MNHTTTTVKFAAVAAISSMVFASANAGIVTWDNGGTGSDFATAANWDPAGEGAYTGLTSDYVIENSGDAVVSASTLAFTTGSLSISAGSLTLPGNPSIGIEGSSLTVSGTGSLSVQFLKNIDVTVQDSGTITLFGGGTPSPNASFDLIGTSSMVHYTNKTVAAFTTEHLSKFTVNSAAAVLGVNLQAVSDGGNGSFITVIPEPGTYALLGGLLALGYVMLRRR